MSGLKISAMQQTEKPIDEALFPIAQNGFNYSVTLANLKKMWAIAGSREIDIASKTDIELIYQQVYGS